MPENARVQALKGGEEYLKEEKMLAAWSRYVFVEMKIGGTQTIG
jgi:hypothetical protein